MELLDDIKEFLRRNKWLAWILIGILCLFLLSLVLSIFPPGFQRFIKTVFWIAIIIIAIKWLHNWIMR